MASRNVWPSDGPQHYRKRRPLPALVLILILGGAAAMVWVNVMDNATETAGVTHCDPPRQTTTTTTKPKTPPTTLGKALEPDALDRTVPAPPGQVLVRVINASTQKGAAGVATARLRELGFTQVAEPANDPLYGPTMTCRGQIRFGQQGTSSARTLSLLAPCLELIRDDRKDPTVDIAIGAEFDNLRPSSDARTVLERLNQWAEEHPETRGGLQSSGPQPSIDADLLAAARQAGC